MLLQIRSLTRGGIAAIILGLVGLAMVITLTPGGIQLLPSTDLANVDDQAIPPARLARELDLTLQAQQQQGRTVTQAQAIQAGLHRRILESLIARTALGVYADRIHIGTSNAQVGQRIREIPRTQNPVTGTFDRNEYQRFLREMRYSETDFEADVRGDLTSGMLLQSLTAGLRAPSSFAAMELVFNSETRTMSVAELPISAAGTVAPPTDAQAQAFYEENQQMFQVPEFRTFSIIYARPSDFAARVTVPEARIRAEYEQRRAQLTQPERRTFVRLAAQTEAQANQAAQRLARGEASDAVAAALGLQVTRGADQSREQVSDPRVAELVFSTPVNAPPRVGRGQLAPWVVVKVESITPAVTPTFESQRDEIRTSIANDEAGELMNTAVSTFDDARAAGTPLPEAARQAGLTVDTFTNVSAEGQARDGQVVAVLRAEPEILRTAFETNEGDASDFIPIGDTDMIISVQQVTPASVRPLADIRQQVSQLYIVRETVRRLQERATAIQTAVEGGTPFAQAVAANRGNIVARSQSIDRASAAQGLPRRFGGLVFSVPEGGVVSDMRPDGRAVLVAHVERVTRADPAQQREAVEATRASSSQESLQSSLVDALQAQIVGSARVRRNGALLDRLYPPEGSEEGEQAPQQ